MATQIVISNGDNIKIDDNYDISWADKGNSMPAIPNTIHCILYNNLTGQNEVQNKDASTGNMTGNVSLNATSDTVFGSTTVANLLTWAETRKGQIEAAKTAYENALDDDQTNGTTNASGKTWIDYDSNYS